MQTPAVSDALHITEEALLDLGQAVVDGPAFTKQTAQTQRGKLVETAAIELWEEMTGDEIRRFDPFSKVDGIVIGPTTLYPYFIEVKARNKSYGTYPTVPLDAKVYKAISALCAATKAYCAWVVVWPDYAAYLMLGRGPGPLPGYSENLPQYLYKGDYYFDKDRFTAIPTFLFDKYLAAIP